METLAGIIIGVPLLLFSYLFFAQDSFLFRGAILEPATIERISVEHPEAEEVRLRTPDDETLHGYYVRGHGVGEAKNGKAPLLIYFGGNAEEVSWLVKEAPNFGPRSLVLINYRGYGLSTGSPGEEEFFEDALLIYDHFTASEDVDQGDVVVMGRSLGSGVAVYLASKRPVRSVILVSPFDSLAEVTKTHLPWVPVGTLLRHRFNSLELAPSLTVPMLAILAERDNVILMKRSRLLVGSWGGETEVAVIPGRGHNDVDLDSGFWAAIGDFLGNCEKGEVPISAVR